MRGYYPEGLWPEDLCHMEGHEYGALDAKPVSTCQRCGYQNFPLRAYIGFVTRRARSWGCSWKEAEDRLVREAEAELEAVGE